MPHRQCSSEQWCERVPAELITIIIIFLRLTLPFDGWWRPLIVLLFFFVVVLVLVFFSYFFFFFFPAYSFSPSLPFPCMYVCSLLLSTKIGDTTLRLYMLRTGEIDIHTHTRARARVSLACELSCIAYKHREICFFLLSSSSHSHLCSLSSCVLACVCDGVVYAY